MTTLTERVAALEAQHTTTDDENAIRYLVKTGPEKVRTPAVYGRTRILRRLVILVPEQSHVVYVSKVIDPNRTITKLDNYGPFKTRAVAEFTDESFRGAQRQAAAWLSERQRYERENRIFRAVVSGEEPSTVRITEGDLR